jgi:carbonic anhydrase/acetyltransferase-like protein (isoleucine patch superfamily)
MPTELPAWAAPRRTYLTGVLDECAEVMKTSGMMIVKFADRLLAYQPKEKLNRLPRLLSVWGKRPQIQDNTFVAPSALLTGDVRVGRKNYIGYNVVLRAEEGQTIYLGESVNVQEKALLSGPCTVGKWSTIEPMAIVDSADIASCSFVGASAIVMRGAKMESNTMLCAAGVLQAGAVIPSGEIWAGNPAQKIGVLTELEKDAIIKAAKHMVMLSIEHRDSWQLTWEEVENIREAREQWARFSEHNREMRIKPFYIKEPPRPNRRLPGNKSPYEKYEGENKPPLMESSHAGHH